MVVVVVVVDGGGSSGGSGHTFVVHLTGARLQSVLPLPLFLPNYEGADAYFFSLSLATLRLLCPKCRVPLRPPPRRGPSRRKIK